MKIKNRKSKIKNCLLAFLVFFSWGCEKWLDGALPRDRNLDDKQFSTETGIHSTLNGLYSRMASADLYGGRLTMTDIELLAHYYYYETQTNLSEYIGYLTFKNISEYQFNDEAIVGSRFNAIWNAAYKTIFEINTFIKNLNESTVLSDERKNVLLGEAYGLRAFIHLDLYRLYGGIVSLDETSTVTQMIPYNNSAEVIPHPSLEPDEFITLLEQDIEIAINYLKNDPILTAGSILDLSPSCQSCPSPAESLSPAEIFNNYLRNYRMNYYAVRALKARFLMFVGRVQEAGQEAQEILNEAFGAGKLFNWADHRRIEEELNRNYIFYEEVIFGITNPDLYSRWRNYTSGTTRGSVYAVHGDVLRENIFKNDLRSEGEIKRWEDVRSRQWLPSLMDDAQYTSIKYERHQFSRYNPREFFQPLIRTGELWYIVAEAKLKAGDRDGAVDILDDFYVRRGAQANRVRPNVQSDADVYSFLETEHYKEFYGEGQAWFYVKRQSSSSIFSGRRGGESDDLTPANFFPFPPQREYDFE